MTVPLIAEPSNSRKSRARTMRRHPLDAHEAEQHLQRLSAFYDFKISSLTCVLRANVEGRQIMFSAVNDYKVFSEITSMLPNYGEIFQ